MRSKFIISSSLISSMSLQLQTNILKPADNYAG